MSLKATTGNTNDRQPVLQLTNDLFGMLVGDKGYLSKGLTSELNEQGVQLITPIKRNMKRVDRTDFEWYLLQHRSLIETVNDQLKNLCQIEHTRHRSVLGFAVNLIAGVIAYCIGEKKPKLPLKYVQGVTQA